MPPPSPEEIVAMTYPVALVAFSFFGGEVLDGTVLLTVFLSAFQIDGVMFHPQ